MFSKVDLFSSKTDKVCLKLASPFSFPILFLPAQTCLHSQLLEDKLPSIFSLDKLLHYDQFAASYYVKKKKQKLSL